MLVAVYYRTNLTLRQIAPLFGVSKSAVGRVVEHLAGHLTLARYGPEMVLIVDGALVPVYDRAVAASSKNYRHTR
ncbi:MAG: transposase family protein [Candidatus Binatia bacterium]